MSRCSVFVADARGSRIRDVDGNKYLDLCLGDTGSMFGHSPKPVVDAARRPVSRGITMMLPTEDSNWVGEELSRRFGLPCWQVAMTATDANRFSIMLAREVTKRKRILVVHGCHHGTIDETLVNLSRAGELYLGEATSGCLCRRRRQGTTWIYTRRPSMSASTLW